MEELKNAIAESLPANATVESLPTDVNTDVKADPSQQAPVETPTTKVEQEVPFHQHPRWKEVMEEKRRAEERAERLERQFYELTNKIATPPQVDPYADKPPEEKAFWKQVETIADQRAEQRLAQREQQYQKELQEQRMLVTSLMYERFQQKHPDIKPGSDEETMIAQKVRQGYSMEDAYTIVTAPMKLRSVEETVRKKYEEEVKKKNEKKLAANLESTNIPSNSPIQGQKKMSVRDIVENHLRGQETA